MHARRIWVAFMAMGLLWLLNGCAIPLEPRLENFSEFKPHGRGNGREAGITLGLDLHNPNPYKIKVLAYDLDIYLNGQKVGDAVHKGKQVMAGKSTSTIRIELTTDLKQMLGGLIGALQGLLGKKPTVEVKIQGVVVAKAKCIQKRVPVDFSKVLEIGD